VDSKLRVGGSNNKFKFGQAPPTFQRGSQPIDGIFMAPQLLEMATGGY